MQQDSVHRIADALKNPRSGWVTRRDAADALGSSAIHTIAALRACESDKDTDVQRAVVEALSRVRDSLSGTEYCRPVLYSVEDLVRYVEKPGQREVHKEGDGFTISINLRAGRKQTIHVCSAPGQDGTVLIHVYSICGKPTQESIQLALKANVKLVRGATAIMHHRGEDALVFVRVLDLKEISPGEFKACVKEVAVYSDWLEQRLSGKEDMF